MKNNVKAYTHKRECSVQETVYHILPELHLQRVFPGVYFVDTNLPEEGSRSFCDKEELNKLTDDNTDIFKRTNMVRYIYRSDRSFSSRKLFNFKLTILEGDYFTLYINLQNRYFR